MLKRFKSHLPRGLNLCPTNNLPAGFDGDRRCESNESQQEPTTIVPSSPSSSSGALSLAPPTLESVDPQNDPNDPSFWSSWADRLRAQLDSSLPSWNKKNDSTEDGSSSSAGAVMVVVQQQGGRPSSQLPRDAMVRALEAHNEALNALEQAQELRDALAKQLDPPVDKAQLDKAVKLVDVALKTVNATDAALQALAPVLLQDPELQHLTSRCYDDSNLLQYTLIANATPGALAAWCDKGGETSTRQLLHLFLTPALLRKFFQATDSGWGLHCGRAIQIWTELTQLAKMSGGGGPHDDDLDREVAARLALAVALEFCGPELDSHAVEHNPLDPVARFHHYQRAYQEEELDPAFASFTVWELRMAINSDATEDELQWGRTCLRNFRPDIAAPDYDPHWRYSFLVRTDVDYKQPDWYKSHRSYDQILSGGGECGPRAWFGRFMCKSFGIPTWGVRQPGHAALSRWTPTGWVTNLGAGFAVSDWDGRCGNDFELETQARRATKGSDAEYRRLVLRLELLARFRGESGQSVRSRCQPDAGNPWFALSLLQRKLLAVAPPDPPSPPRHVVVRGEQLVRSLYVAVSSVIASAPSTPSNVLPHQDGSIVVPASAATIDKSNAGKASILDSWGGGHQLLLSHDSEARFSVDLPSPPSTLAAASTQSYHLTMLVCTVHRLAQPLLVTIDQANDSNDDSSSPSPPVTIEIALPYTLGAWKETEPVNVELPPASTHVVLTVKRQEPKLGLSIQFLKLVPATTEQPK